MELHAIYYQRNGGEEKSQRRGEDEPNGEKNSKTDKQDSTYCSQCGHEADIETGFALLNSLLNKKKN